MAEDWLGPEQFSGWLAEEEAKRTRRERQLLSEAQRNFDAAVAEWLARDSHELASWAHEISQLGPVGLSDEYQITPQTDLPAENPFMLDRAEDWYTFATIDLYDRQCFCRRCGAKSDVYIRTHGRPPTQCPACGFEGRAR